MSANHLTNETCPRCGTERIPGRLMGLCPVCLVDVSAPRARSFGQYELMDEIARGGMGVVYRARQQGLDRVVALKLILAGQFASEQSKERFRAEARAAAKLRHPNIVPVHEVGEHHGFLFYSMEYVPGQNLALAAQEKPMAAKPAAECLRQIAVAVEFA